MFMRQYIDVSKVHGGNLIDFWKLLQFLSLRSNYRNWVGVQRIFCVGISDNISFYKR